jgi:signal transduction histidine kinase
LWGTATDPQVNQPDAVQTASFALWARNGGSAMVVEVQDSGPGIDLFDAFVTTKPRGTGLGLAICRMIVERHGGQLSATSDGQNGRYSKSFCR